MTNEMMNTARGCAAAALVASLALTLGACKEGGIPQEEYDDIVLKMERLHDDIQDLKDDHSEEKARLLKKLDETAEEAAAIEAKVSTLEAELEAAKQASDAIAEEFEAYKQEYRVSLREKAQGMKFTEIAKLDGTVFKDITLSKLDPVEVRFLYSEGVGSLALSDLKPEHAETFGFDEIEALAFIESKKNPTTGGEGDIGFEQDRESKVDYQHELKKLANKRQQNADLRARLATRLAELRGTIGQIDGEIAQIRRLGKNAFGRQSAKDPKQQIAYLSEKAATMRANYAALSRQNREAN